MNQPDYSGTTQASYFPLPHRVFLRKIRKYLGTYLNFKKQHTISFHSDKKLISYSAVATWSELSRILECFRMISTFSTPIPFLGLPSPPSPRRAVWPRWQPLAALVRWDQKERVRGPWRGSRLRPNPAHLQTRGADCLRPRPRPAWCLRWWLRPPAGTLHAPNATKR